MPTSHRQPKLQDAGRRVHKIKNTGVTFDSALTFEDHINGVVRSCNFHIRVLRQIRHNLTREVANMVACSIVGTRIDYSNSLFYSTSEKHLDKLQRLQNAMAYVVTNTGLRDYHSVDLLRELHWLPIQCRITFKVATLCCRALNDGQPTYLASRLNSYRPTRSLRSSKPGTALRSVLVDSRALCLESGT